MKIARSRLTAQDRTSVPAEVRRRLGLGPGSVLEWDAEGELVTLRRVGRYTFEDLHRALFTRAPEARDLAALRDGIRRHARARHARH